MFELQLKNFLAQFFKTDVHLGKQPLSKTVPAIPQKMCGSYVTMDFIFYIDFKGNKNATLATISKSKNVTKNRWHGS